MGEVPLYCPISDVARLVRLLSRALSLSLCFSLSLPLTLSPSPCLSLSLAYFSPISFLLALFLSSYDVEGYLDYKKHPPRRTLR